MFDLVWFLVVEDFWVGLLLGFFFCLVFFGGGLLVKGFLGFWVGCLFVVCLEVFSSLSFRVTAFIMSEGIVTTVEALQFFKP